MLPTRSALLGVERLEARGLVGTARSSPQPPSAVARRARLEVVVLILLLLAARIQRYLGAAGIMVITQIMGLVLAAYSVQQVLDGVVKVFGRAGH